MDEQKFEGSVKRFRERMEDIQNVRRVTQRLPDNIMEQPTSHGKRMRLINTTSTADDTKAKKSTSALLRPCHPPQRICTDTTNNELPVVVFPNAPGGTALFRADLERLREGFFLHDRLINLMLEWVLETHVSPSIKPDIQLCDSFMFTQLTRNVEPKEVTCLNAILKANFERVRNYRRNKGPGGCPITLLPICEDDHWFILFILISKSESANDVAIWIADSYPVTSRTYVAKIIQLYLEYTLPGTTTTHTSNLEVMRQQNGYDCGLHTIHNALRFMQHIKTAEETDQLQVVAALNQTPVISRQEIKHTLDSLATEQRNGTPTTTILTTQTNSSSTRRVEQSPSGEAFNLPKGQIIALDTHSVLENKCDDNWLIYNANISELMELVATLKTEMRSKNQRRVKKLGNVGGRLLSLRLWEKSGFTRIVCIGDSQPQQ